MKQKGFIGPVFLYLIGIIIILVLGVMFVAKPLKVYSENVTPPFKPKQLILAEKITYLFKKPNIGDRVIFIPQNTETTYVGLITNSENQGDVTTYTIVSISDSKRPWKVSSDKITGKIYYPFLDPVETAQIALSLLSASTPSPSPEPVNSVPTSESSVSSDTTDWKIYTNSKLNIMLKYPINFAVKENILGFSDKPGSSISFSNEQVRFVILDYASGIGATPKKISEITVDGVSAKEYNFGSMIQVSFNNQVRDFTVFYTAVNGIFTKEELDIFNQILSTFKFLP